MSAWLPLKIFHQRSNFNVAQNSHRFHTLTPSISNSPHKCKPRIDGCRHYHWANIAAQAVPAGRRRSKYARLCPVPRADLVLCQLAHTNVHDATLATYLHCFFIAFTTPPIKPWHCLPLSSSSSSETTASCRPEA